MQTIEPRDQRFWFAPLLLPAALFCFFAIQRVVHLLIGPTVFGHMTDAQARDIASQLCQQFTGESVVPESLETTPLTLFSPHRKRDTRVWEVECTSAETQYLFRINADTGQVFGVNRLSPEDVRPGQTGVSRAQAEALARRYLGLIGVPAATPLPRAHSVVEPGRWGKSWNFRYRQRVPGGGKHLLTVAVDPFSGALDSIW